MQELTVTSPLDEKTARRLHAGESILLSGVIYTARDAAHRRMCQTLDEGGTLPFDLRDAVIYYVGPTPAREGRVIGSAGPTTSGRMDAYAPRLISLGLRGMIGKGARDDAVVQAMVRYGAVYFGAIGGAGALLSRCILSSELVAYEDLGSEAVRRLEVCRMPLTVVIDAQGNNLYRLGPERYRSESARS